MLSSNRSQSTLGNNIGVDLSICQQPTPEGGGFLAQIFMTKKED